MYVEISVILLMLNAVHVNGSTSNCTARYLMLHCIFCVFLWSFVLKIGLLGTLVNVG